MTEIGIHLFIAAYYFLACLRVIHVRLVHLLDYIELVYLCDDEAFS
jgi:hypothetical protein